MKHLITIAVVFASLAPFSAQADAMSDTRFVAANRCLAYADHRALQGDTLNVESLRAAVEEANGSANAVALARADEVRSQVRRQRGNNEARLERLRADREAACASFVTQGLVVLDSSPA